jgi:hypothetical protein
MIKEKNSNYFLFTKKGVFLRMYDLHVHTTASDGTCTPQEVLDRAVEIGLSGLAITDHDTVDGLELAQRYCIENKLQIDFIPGIELSTEDYGEEIHILGYFFDSKNVILQKRLKEIREARVNRAHKIINRLNNIGINISISDVRKYAGEDFIGRPHIARALIDQGYIMSVKEGFERYIGKGKPAYVPRYKFMPQEAIKLIKEADGISILAHPGLIENSRVIRQIVNMGIDGLEVYYPEHTRAQMAEFTRICHENNFLLTGGSDYHGLESTDSKGNLGCTGVSWNLMKKMYLYKRQEGNKI